MKKTEKETKTNTKETKACKCECECGCAEGKVKEKKVRVPKDNKFTRFIQKYGKSIGLAVGGFAVGVVGMFILWPDRITTINGEDVVATYKGANVTADGLYQDLKTSYGLNTLLTKVDMAILLNKYPNQEEDAKKYAEDTVKEYFEAYKLYYGIETMEEFYDLVGATEEQVLSELTNDYYYNKNYDEYLDEVFDEATLEKEYKANYFADKEVYVFTASKKDSLKNVKTALNNKKSFDTIKSKYTSVDCSETTISYANVTKYSDKFITNLVNLKKGKSSCIFKDGDVYTLIYLVSNGEKATFEESKDTVKEVLVNKDANIQEKSLLALREKNDFKIADTEIQEVYNKYLKELK